MLLLLYVNTVFNLNSIYLILNNIGTKPYSRTCVVRTVTLDERSLVSQLTALIFGREILVIICYLAVTIEVSLPQYSYHMKAKIPKFPSNTPEQDRCKSRISLVRSVILTSFTIPPYVSKNSKKNILGSKQRAKILDTVLCSFLVLSRTICPT